MSYRYHPYISLYFDGINLFNINNGITEQMSEDEKVERQISNILISEITFVDRIKVLIGEN